MKTKPMKKAEHIAWLAQLDAELLAIGAEPFTYREAKTYADGSGSCVFLPGYRFQTRFGPLELHPDIPSSPRLNFDCTVYGRFTGDNWPGKGVCQPNPKWNFHLDPRSGSETLECATHVADRVIKLL